MVSVALLDDIITESKPLLQVIFVPHFLLMLWKLKVDSLPGLSLRFSKSCEINDITYFVTLTPFGEKVKITRSPSTGNKRKAINVSGVRRLMTNKSETWERD